jgi:hypothetical protein
VPRQYARNVGDPTLQLTAECVAVLKKHGAAAYRLDLAEAYSFEHPLNSSRELQTLWAGRTRVFWGIDFFDPSGNKVLEVPLGRNVGPAPLFETPGRDGLVAVNDIFRIRPTYQRQLLSKAVYARENELYRVWNVSEIQVFAMWDGPVVWVQKEDFLPRDPDLVADQYAEWAKEQNLNAHPPEHPRDYPESFLRTFSEKGLALYKVLK